MITGIAATGTDLDCAMVREKVPVLWAEAERAFGKRRVGAKVGAGGSVRAIQPKGLGEMAEAAFLAKVSRLGFGVAGPGGDSDRYVFIVDTGGKLWRVQVKSAHRAGQDGCYSFRMHGSSLAGYRPNEVDV